MTARGVATALLLLFAAAGGAPSASAHDTDPSVVTVLDSVTPALPAAVVVQVASSVAAQLVVANPTDVPVEVLSDTGEVFLRISSAGVAADLGSQAWYDSNLPSGRAAVASAELGRPRFARVHSGASWGWFDHRLHPAAVGAPSASRGARTAVRLGDWSVPLRYGDTAVTVRGHVEHRPVLGRVVTAVTSAVPAGVELRTVDGRIPGVFLRRTSAATVRVLDAEGQVFLRMEGGRVLVNERSLVHVEDQRARGRLPALAPAGDGFRLVGAAPSYSWLDPRLRHLGSGVPDEIQQRAYPTVLRSWSIPLDVGAGPVVVTGVTSFVPYPTATPSDDGPGLPLLLLGGGAAFVLLALTIAGRRRTYDAEDREG